MSHISVLRNNYKTESKHLNYIRLEKQIKMLGYKDNVL
jgi:hypothetical protein